MGAKLDLGKAWSDAVALLGANKDVVLIVAGVFFFLPNMLVAMFVPDMAEPAVQPDAANIEAFYAQYGEMMGAYFASYWWAFAALAIVQTIGVLGLLTLLTDSNRPTVGTALQIGALGVFTYIVIQLLIIMAFGLLFTLSFMAGMVVGGLAVLPLLLLFIYVSVKLSLVTPVIAIERELNPIKAMGRSWKLTKGNSLRIFAFFLLLILVLIVLTLIASLLFSLFTLMGDTVGNIVVAIGEGLISMVSATISLGVLAAIYFQLSGSGPKQAEVFD